MDPVEQEQPTPPVGDEAPVEGASTTGGAPVGPDAGGDAAPPVTADQVAIEVPDPVSPGDDGGYHPGAIELVGGGALGLILIGLAGWIVLRQQRPLPVPGGLPVPAETVEASPVDDSMVPAEEGTAADEGLIVRFRAALTRSRAALQERFDQILGGGAIDESLFEDLEMALLSADVGVPTTERLLAPLKELVRQGETDPTVLREALRVEITELLSGFDVQMHLAPPGEGPAVILVVGVNGSGKTTTIGKLAARFTDQGHKVMLAAADTYRAAAAEQLQIWAERSGADIVAHQEGADPGAVVYDALQAAKARGHDVVLVDTAGRLQTKKPLMDQLGKVRRVIDKIVPGGPHETLLVLDGTMGQNGLSQARLFNEATPLSGVAITKLDGTAKGGMILTIAAELDLPVKWVGIGEKMDDLKPFDALAFAAALA